MAKETDHSISQSYLIGVAAILLFGTLILASCTGNDFQYVCRSVSNANLSKNCK